METSESGDGFPTAMYEVREGSVSAPETGGKKFSGVCGTLRRKLRKFEFLLEIIIAS